MFIPYIFYVSLMSIINDVMLVQFQYKLERDKFYKFVLTIRVKGKRNGRFKGL